MLRAAQSAACAAEEVDIICLNPTRERVPGLHMLLEITSNASLSSCFCSLLIVHHHILSNAGWFQAEVVDSRFDVGDSQIDLVSCT